MADKTYRVGLKCSNCGWNGPETIPKGVTVEDGAAECPRCGCRTLRRHAPAADWRRSIYELHGPRRDGQRICDGPTERNQRACDELGIGRRSDD